MRGIVLCVMMTSLLCGPAWGQKKVLSAAYLKASIGAIDDRRSVTIRAEYLVDPGMTQAEGWRLRNKGYSRFSIRDPQTGAVFESMYCKQESDVFWELLNAEGNKELTFHGEKGSGEDREGAIFVSRIDSVLLTPTAVARRIANAKEPETTPLRVTIVNEETGTRTVLTGVKRGTPVKVEGLAITVEDEPEE
jgi:hypothetical protein